MEHLRQLFTAELLVALAGLWSAAATFAALRMKRWINVYLDREKQRDAERTAREVQRHNETLRILSEASASPAPPTLDSLLADEKRDWSLPSSQTPSAPAGYPTWDDEDLQTETLRETPSAKRGRP